MSTNSDNEGGVLVPLQIGLPEQTQLRPADFMAKMHLVIFGDGTPGNLPNPQVQEIIEKRRELYDKALNAKVEDDTTLAESETTEKELKELKKSLVSGFDDTRTFYFEIHREVLKIQNKIGLDIDAAINHIGRLKSRYNTEKWQKVAEENARKLAAAEATRRKELAAAAVLKTPEKRAEKEFIARTIVADIDPIPETNFSKEVQITDTEKFFKRVSMIPGMHRHLKISATGLKQLIDNNWDLDKAMFIRDRMDWRLAIVGGAAVIIAKKK